MFISTRGSTADAAPIERVRWHQTPYGAKRQTRVIPIHRLGAEYFAYRDIVDQHNRSRQDTLNLEKKFEVKSWDMRVNTTLIGILVVDASTVSRRHDEVDKRRRHSVRWWRQPFHSEGVYIAPRKGPRGVRLGTTARGAVDANHFEKALAIRQQGWQSHGDAYDSC